MKRSFLPRPIPVDPTLLAPGVVLAFDAALSNTGWAMLRRDDLGALTVLGVGTIRTATSFKSHEGSYDKAGQLAAGLGPLLPGWAGAVVCERPAVAGHRTESAFLAAYTIHAAAAETGAGPVRLVSRTHVLSLLLGPGKHPKAASTACARRWLPGVKFNEHTADAALLGITHLFDTAAGDAP